MHFKETTKVRLSSAARKVIAVVVMMTICIASVVSVMATMIDITVVDGDTTVTFEITGSDEERVINKAVTNGIDPLGPYDVAVFNEKRDVLTIYRAVEATVIDAEKEVVFPTVSYQISRSSILAQATATQGIAPIGADDLVSFDQETYTVEIFRGIQVSFSVDGDTTTLPAHTGDTVADLLAAQGITLGDADVLSPKTETALEDAMQISLTRQYHITIIADSSIKEVAVPAGTVSQTLAKLNLQLAKDDTVDVGLSAKIYEGMKIRIGRVEYREVTKEEEVAYVTLTRESDAIPKGTTQIDTYGQNGVRTILVKEKLLDGTVIDSEELKNEITTEPINEVLLIGTGKDANETPEDAWSESPANDAPADTPVSGSTLVDLNGTAIEYTSMLSGLCTAYSGGGTTATGVPAQVGHVAVNPNVIPYGTRLYICSPDGSIVYGYAIASDTGGAVMSGNYLADLYYNTSDECYRFGIRTMNVYILK